MSVSWDYFNKFEYVIDTYMPMQGEGDSLGSQIVTAINKLIYKWYNDGDVYDNCHGMEGWANDLSSYANWLYKYCPRSRSILERIYDCFNSNEYESILKDLADACLDAEDIENYSKKPVSGSIYNCDGPFEWTDDWDDEDEYEEEEYYDDEEDDEYY